MPSFIYSPAIEVHVQTKDGIIDISEDLVSWSLTRRENAVSTFHFELQNAQRKYDGKLLPMDKISVRMKRIAWVQAFTGYLNDGPIFQAWPGSLSISASCTLKRMQFWYWDPGSISVLTLVRNTLGRAVDAEGHPQSESRLGDRGLSKLIGKLVSTVMTDPITKESTWPERQIHIGDIPQDWFAFASGVVDDIKKDTDIYEELGGFASGALSANGSFNGVSALSAGTYGGQSYDETQLKWATGIYETVVFTEHLPSWIATLCFMCALVESGLRNIASANVRASQSIPHDDYPGSPDKLGHDHGSLGLYQQQTGTAWVEAGYGNNQDQTTINSPDGWGPPADLMDVVKATQKFLDKLKNVLHKDAHGNYVDITTSSATTCADAVQKVQISDPNAYAEKFTTANALRKAFDAAKAAGKVAAADVGNNASLNPTRSDPTSRRTTGSQLAATAVGLINEHKPPAGQYIIYSQSGCDPQDTDIGQVSTLDCSSLVNWVYYHATAGTPWPGSGAHERGPVSGEQWAACPHRVGEADYEVASRIQGALLFGGASGSEHVGISLGNGQHVAAHDHYPDPSLDCNISSCIPSSNFHPSPVSVGLAPGIDYTNAATDQASAALLKRLLKKPSIGIAPPIPADGAGVTSSPATGDAGGTNPGLAFGALLETLTVGNPGVDPASNALIGRVALMNDQPFLPWLENLFTSSLRSFCSAPNGDLIGWFPDYFNLWGIAGVVNIELIELQDFVVKWSDQQIVTHQFVIGNPNGYSQLDLSSGQIGFPSLNGGIGDMLSLARGTAGIATMDYPEIFEAIYGQKASSEFILEYLRRYGARPQTDQMPMIQGKGKAEFFMALYLFMQRWAGQFTADIPVTFMPEVFPGMIVKIPAYGFQAYVTEVTHSGSYGDGGGFQTTISIKAPASTEPSAGRADLLALLPSVTGVLTGATIREDAEKIIQREKNKSKKHTQGRKGKRGGGTGGGTTKKPTTPRTAAHPWQGGPDLPSSYTDQIVGGTAANPIPWLDDVVANPSAAYELDIAKWAVSGVNSKSALKGKGFTDDQIQHYIGLFYAAVDSGAISDSDQAQVS